jgi:hypothetical protein
MKSIPNLSQIVSLNFTNDSSIHSTYPPTILARQLLDKMPKVDRLLISYDYLLCLLRSSLIVMILKQKIKSLTIIFATVPPLLPDMIRILDVFSINLLFLYFNIRSDLPVNKFYHIVPLLFGGICKQLRSFHLRLWKGSQQQPHGFDDQFKLRLKKCLTAQIKNKARFSMMEYRIQDTKVFISF